MPRYGFMNLVNHPMTAVSMVQLNKSLAQQTFHTAVVQYPIKSDILYYITCLLWVAIDIKCSKSALSGFSTTYSIQQKPYCTGCSMWLNRRMVLGCCKDHLYALELLENQKQNTVCPQSYNKALGLINWKGEALTVWWLKWHFHYNTCQFISVLSVYLVTVTTATLYCTYMQKYLFGVWRPSVPLW